jgi:hypothetical protein
VYIYTPNVMISLSPPFRQLASAPLCFSRCADVPPLRDRIRHARSISGDQICRARVELQVMHKRFERYALTMPPPACRNACNSRANVT